MTLMEAARLHSTNCVNFKVLWRERRQFLSRFWSALRYQTKEISVVSIRRESFFFFFFTVEQLSYFLYAQITTSFYQEFINKLKLRAAFVFAEVMEKQIPFSYTTRRFSEASNFVQNRVIGSVIFFLLLLVFLEF